MGAAIFALAHQPSPADASGTPIRPAGQNTLAAYDRYVVLTLPARLEVGKRSTIVLYGSANPGDELSVFVDPAGQGCPASVSAQPARAISLISEADYAGEFFTTTPYKPRRAGERSFCAYLGTSTEQVSLEANDNVFARLLKALAARRAVVTALKRHGFARRVVKSLERDCRRRSRNVFTCTFSGGFPGYRLTGRGRVRLGIDLSYRFPVKAQGVRLTLTDENEQPNSR